MSIAATAAEETQAHERYTRNNDAFDARESKERAENNANMQRHSDMLRNVIRKSLGEPTWPASADNHNRESAETEETTCKATPRHASLLSIPRY